MRRRCHLPAVRTTAWLPVLAMLLRLLLPILHDGHDCHRHQGAVAAACCCGTAHAPIATGGSAPQEQQSEQPDSELPGICFACQQQHHSPAAPPRASRLAPPRGGVDTRLPSLASNCHSCPPADGPPTRAPPDGRA